MATKPKQRNTRTMYMHTWFGEAAVWIESQQRIRVLMPGDRITLADSHATIRRQQRIDDAAQYPRYTDAKQGYGYVRVEVPANA